MSIEWNTIFSTRAAFRRAKENCYYINQNLISKQFSCARCSPTQPPLGSGECPQCFRSTASAFMVRFRTSPDNPSVMVASSAWTLVLEAVRRNRSARRLHRSPTTRRRCRPPFSRLLRAPCPGLPTRCASRCQAPKLVDEAISAATLALLSRARRIRRRRLRCQRSPGRRE